MKNVMFLFLITATATMQSTIGYFEKRAMRRAFEDGWKKDVSNKIVHKQVQDRISLEMNNGSTRASFAMCTQKSQSHDAKCYDEYAQALKAYIDLLPKNVMVDEKATKKVHFDDLVETAEKLLNYLNLHEQ